jgi:hypothetical protein
VDDHDLLPGKGTLDQTRERGLVLADVDDLGHAGAPVALRKLRRSLLQHSAEEARLAVVGAE